MNPQEDGTTHINIYSKGNTTLGQFLSNFSDCHIWTEDGYFRTIEGYWYWLSCKDDRLRNTSGWESKKLGRALKGSWGDWPKTPGFEQKILKAIATKIQQPWCVEQLIKSGTLPFFHYYVLDNGRTVEPKDGLWMVNFITEFRDELVRSRT